MHKKDEKPIGLRLAQADRAIQRTNLQEKIRALGGILPEAKGDAVSDLELNFLKRVVAWEEGPFTTNREWLAERGLVFKPPGDVGRDELKSELWRLIEALSVARVFLENTDHLDDAGLYARLWNEVMKDESPEVAREANAFCHWDLCESASDPDNWLTYYASEDEREEWASEFPEFILPAHRQPPHRRDHRLPAID